ncbi:MAG: hypothetical protein LBU42_00765 [Prevotellaceae bacterium]|jgi:hypothetical protein|nr:hypothetical protein [Prevotellaceae bacterium]
MTRNYRKFYALLAQMPHNEKEELVLQFTNSRTDSLSAMSDAEFGMMLSTMEGFIKANTLAAHAPDMDAWRKRVMASIGGWLRACGTQHTPDSIKAIACRAAQRKAFNDITLSELRAIYAEFLNKQKAAKRTICNI